MLSLFYTTTIVGIEFGFTDMSCIIKGVLGKPQSIAYPRGTFAFYEACIYRGDFFCSFLLPISYREDQLRDRTLNQETFLLRRHSLAWVPKLPHTAERFPYSIGVHITIFTVVCILHFPLPRKVFLSLRGVAELPHEVTEDQTLFCWSCCALTPARAICV